MADHGAPLPGARLIADSDAVRAAYARLADALQPVVTEGNCVLIAVLMGGMVPLVHLAQRLHGDFLMDYCHLTRYRGATTGGPITWIYKPRQVLRERTVVLVDDIFDQGRTLAEVARSCRHAGARTVLTAVLVRKHHQRPSVEFVPDFVGLEIGDEYVFGCGMDYQQRWRHLDALWALPATLA
jgi:hypoxanthine phosphoribosyltransferase